MINLKRLSIMLIFTIVAIFAFPSDNSEAASYKAGDIFITKSTSAKGVTGHVGIAISSNTILHTSGRKNAPYPKNISISKWKREYPKTQVIRPKSSSLGKKAAQKAFQYFASKKIKYNITANPKDIDPYTYCSELVWYSYYKAGKQYKVASQRPSGSLKWHNPSVVYPYDYSNPTYVKHNGFKFIDNSW